MSSTGKSELPKKNLDAQKEAIESALKLSGLNDEEFARRVGIKAESLRKARKGYQAASRQLLQAMDQAARLAAAERKGGARTGSASATAPAFDNTPLARLQSALSQAGLDAAQLAHLIDRPVGYIQAVLAGDAPLSQNGAERVAGVLGGLSAADLMRGSDVPLIVSEAGTEGTVGAKPVMQVPPGSTSRYVPILAWAQAGQYHIEHTDEAYEHAGKLAVDLDDRRAFALIVEGDSMSPDINPGDRVFVCPSWTPRAGDRVVAKTVHGDVYLKLLERNASDRVVLASINKNHQTIELQRRDLAWIYPVAEVNKVYRRK